MPAHHGMTPLIAAAGMGAAERRTSDVVHPPDLTKVIELLVSAGADVNTRDSKYQRTALGWALKSGYTEIVGLLKAHGATE
jgi:hypothetical protein